MNLLGTFIDSFQTVFANAALEFLGTRAFRGKNVSYQILSHDSFGLHAETSSVGLLMQGPLLHPRHVANVKKTYDFYTAMLPDSKIALSTWDGALDLISRSGGLPSGLQVVTSPDPGPSMPSNLLRQSVSTFRGIQELSKNPGITHILKNRTDQRFLSPTLPYKLMRLSQEPSTRDKIHFASYGTGAIRIYGGSDQAQFGPVGLLGQYWDPKAEAVSSKYLLNTSSPLGSDWISAALRNAPEILLHASFLARRGWALEWSWPDHVRAMIENFGILNTSELSLIHLGGKQNRIDHVTLSSSSRDDLIERHLTAELLGAFEASLDHWQPSVEDLREALKIPPKERPQKSH